MDGRTDDEWMIDGLMDGRRDDSEILELTTWT